MLSGRVHRGEKYLVRDRRNETVSGQSCHAARKDCFVSISKMAVGAARRAVGIK